MAVVGRRTTYNVHVECSYVYIGMSIIISRLHSVNSKYRLIESCTMHVNYFIPYWTSWPSLFRLSWQNDPLSTKQIYYYVFDAHRKRDTKFASSRADHFEGQSKKTRSAGSVQDCITLDSVAMIGIDVESILSKKNIMNPLMVDGAACGNAKHCC